MMDLVPGIDVSTWDGDPAHTRTLDWSAYTWPFVFIKCSEGLAVDPLFRRQWAAARTHTLRGAYHFFRPIVDPKESVKKMVEHLGADRGELPAVLDIEVTDGLGNILDRAKSWLAWYEDLTGTRPIIYSRTSFIRDVLHCDRYPYLAKYRIWLAEYHFEKMEPASVRKQRIADILSGDYPISFPKPPSPFQRVSFYQWTALGTPAMVPGYYTGADGKKEIDLNFYNGSLEDLLFEFNVEGIVPPEPPIGDPMEGKILKLTNMRGSPTQYSTDLGDFVAGDRVTWSTEMPGSDGLTYCYIIAATRDGIPVKRTDGKTVAAAPVWGWKNNIEVITPPEPPTPDTTLPDLPVSITLGDDVTYTRQTVNVTLKPKT